MADTSERDGGGNDAPTRSLRRWAPALVALLGLAVTGAATSQIALVLHAKDQRRFEAWAEKTHSIAQERVQYHLTRLHGLAAGLLIDEAGAPDPRFDRHVRQVLEHDPSVRGIGLAVEAPGDGAARSDGAALSQGARDSGTQPGPAASHETIYFRSAGPADGRGLDGLGSAAEPVLRAAMARALELGGPVLSPGVKPPGGLTGPAEAEEAMVLFIPAQQPGASSPREGDGAEVRGCVYAILDTARFWQAVFPSSPTDRLRVEVYDGESEDPLWAQEAVGVRGAKRSRFHDTRRLTVAGHTFTLALDTLPEFHAGSLWGPAVGGTVIVGLVVTGGLFLVSRAQARAWQTADRAAAKLRASQRQLEEINRTLEHRVARRTAVAEHRAAQLQRLARQLTRAEQDERRRLARVLHDHLQQVLVAARIQVKLMEGDAGGGSWPAARGSDGASGAGSGVGGADSPPTAQLDALLQEALDACRSLTVELSPPVLHTAGLVPALEWLARQTQRKYRLGVDLGSDPPAAWDAERSGDGIELDIRVFLFQAVRELLFNAAKYAGADRVSVRVTRPDGQRVRVSVEDGGVGFDPEVTAEEREVGGFGLFSIRERAQLLGGAMHLHSAPGRGTHIVLTLPCRKPPRPRRGADRAAKAAGAVQPPLHPTAAE